MPITRGCIHSKQRRIKMNEENWREGSILEQNKHMLLSGFRSDCTFLVGQDEDAKEFCAHKLILSRSSDVFNAMFHGALREKQIVRLTDITPAAFQALLYHVYCDTLELSDVEMTLDVCSAAHKYNMQPLINKCTLYIRDHMTAANVCQVLEFSNLTDNKTLQEHCIKLLRSDTEDVLSADSWCQVQVSSIVTLLQQDMLNVESELILLTACQRWALHQVNNQHEVKEINTTLTEDLDKKHVTMETQHDTAGNDNKHSIKNYMNCEKLRKISQPFLSHLRILSLSPKQFLQATKENNIFSEQDKYTILKCYADSDEYKMPVGFCEIITSRNKPHNNNLSSSEDEFFTVRALKSHLKGKKLESVEFELKGNTGVGSNIGCSYLKISKASVNICQNIVIYGFQLSTLHFNKQDSIMTALAENKEYDEKFTLKFIKNETIVSKNEFDGKLKFDDTVNFDLLEPILARENSQYDIQLEFHHHHTSRHYPYYQNLLQPSEEFTMNDHINICCLTKVFYKIV